MQLLQGPFPHNAQRSTPVQRNKHYYQGLVVSTGRGLRVAMVSTGQTYFAAVPQCAGITKASPKLTPRSPRGTSPANLHDPWISSPNQVLHKYRGLCKSRGTMHDKKTHGKHFPKAQNMRPRSCPTHPNITITKALTFSPPYAIQESSWSLSTSLSLMHDPYNPIPLHLGSTAFAWHL